MRSLLDEERGRAPSNPRTRTQPFFRLGTGRDATFQSWFGLCLSDWSPFCSPRTHCFKFLNLKCPPGRRRSGSSTDPPPSAGLLPRLLFCTRLWWPALLWPKSAAICARLYNRVGNAPRMEAFAPSRRSAGRKESTLGGLRKMTAIRV